MVHEMKISSASVCSRSTKNGSWKDEANEMCSKPMCLVKKEVAEKGNWNHKITVHEKMNLEKCVEVCKLFGLKS